MCRQLRLVHFVLFVFSIGCFAAQAQKQDTIDVLFIGNSYTYFWNLPQVVQAMAESRGLPVRTRQSTAGGANLGQHWRGARNLNGVDLIRSEQFEMVVLQDHSMRAIDNPDSLLFYGEKFASLIRSSGSQPILYMTWARSFNPLMFGRIAEGYWTLGTETDAVVAPVGEAWEYARELRPELMLYDPDGSHPSPTGTYLSACVLYAIITGESPVGLPTRLLSEDIYGEKLYLSIVPPGDALFCQQVADEVVSHSK